MFRLGLSNGDDLRLLARYISGGCPPREAAAVRDRLATDAAFAALYDELRAVWQASAPPEDGFDAQASWQALDTKRRHLPPPQSAVRPLQLSGPARLTPGAPPRAARSSRRTNRRRPRLPYGWAVATLCAVAALAVVAGSFLPAPEEAAPAARVFATEPGLRATVRLVDGTTVHLNVDSRLTVPAAFNERARAVRLEGQALFEVAPDAAHPFHVRAGESEVRVLGTTFDVRAYAGEPAVAVVVTEGLVALGTAAPAGAPADTVLLRPNHLGLRTEAGLRVQRAGVDVGRRLAWRSGQLVFEDASWEEVARELERWYDLRVELDASAGRVRTLNASFGDEPLSEILGTIGAALDLDYDRERRHIVFRAAQPSP